MSNEPLAGSLPAHLRDGRGSGAGPTTGGYVTFCIGPEDIAADISTGEALIGFVAPFDMRIERVTWHGSAYGAGTAETALYKKASGSFATSGATAILATGKDLTADQDYSGSDFASSAARNVDQGDAVFIDPITQASTGTVTDLVIVITAYVQDHVNADPADD